MPSDRDRARAEKWLEGLREFFARMTGGEVTDPEGFIDADSLASLLADVRAEERERICAALCPACAECGEPNDSYVDFDNVRKPAHVRHDGKYARCRAAAIRAASAGED